MPAIHVRNVPESVVTALRERAERHGQSMQQEIRTILEAAAAASPAPQELEPIALNTVRTGRSDMWRREDLYDDTDR